MDGAKVPVKESSGDRQGDDFDFVAARQVKKPTNVLESTGHLVKGCLGGGLLGIHEAYMKAGLWTSIIFTFIFGLYITYCVHLLVNSAQTMYKRLRVTELSYPDLAEAATMSGPFPRFKKFGKLFRYAVDVVIGIDLFGSCAVYQIIIAKTIKQLVENDPDAKDDANIHIRIYIVALLIPILMLGMIRTLKYLAPFSLLADLCIDCRVLDNKPTTLAQCESGATKDHCYDNIRDLRLTVLCEATSVWFYNLIRVVCVISTVVYSLRVAPSLSARPAWKSFGSFFEFCGVVVFSMEGVGVCLPIENNMKNPKKYPIVLIAGMTVVVCFVATVGFFGYWGYGEDCKSPVTLNFPMETFPKILKGMAALMIYMTYALNFWAPFNLVWYYIAKKYDPSKHWFWERVYRAIIISGICVVSIVFPNIGNLMGLLGAFCLSNMGFIFPALIELLIVWETPGLGRFKWRLWKNILIIFFGCILFVAGTFNNFKGLINKMLI